MAAVDDLADVPRGALVERPVVRDDGEARDAIAVEEPLEIRVDGETVGVTMRTPGDDAHLALGFLFAEGIIALAADVGTIVHCGRPGEEGFGNVLDVRSAAGTRIDPERVLEGRRFLPVSSACGVCGRVSIERLIERLRPVADRSIPRALVAAGMEALARRQPVFRRTGGLHAAALLALDGEVIAAAEDVGRHNAVDKVIGAALLAGRAGAAVAPRDAPALLAVSGRAGFEIVQKGVMAGVAAIASVSAPSSLAVDLSVAAGVMLAGFVRGERMNVYAHSGRLRPQGG
jgi:FdhD protein